VPQKQTGGSCCRPRRAQREQLMQQHDYGMSTYYTARHTN
jgi:hypothetical protein